jgi:hypothetical protein
MAMESPAYALLAAYAPLTALVPSARIRKSGYAGESPVAPYITIQEIGGAPANYIAGRPGMDLFRPTVKVVAATEAESKTIAGHVRDALELSGHCLLFDGPEYESEVKLYVHFSDWHFHVSR